MTEKRDTNTKSIKVSVKAHSKLRIMSAKTQKPIIKIIDDFLFIKKIKKAVKE